MKKGIVFAAVTLITAFFLNIFVESGTIKKDSVAANQPNEKKAAKVSNSTQTQFVYGSKKKLMSDF